MISRKTAMRGGLAMALVLGFAACEDDMNMGRFGGGSERPPTDSRGVITYPTYQVAVAQPGDTVRIMAARLGQDTDEMAKLNAIHPDMALASGEVLVLPNRIETLDGPDIGGRQPGAVDIETLAGNAIDAADPPRAGEPRRHVVRAGETVEGIAARYRVPTDAVMTLNGLRSNTGLRQGQTLLIPAAPATPRAEPKPKPKPVRPAVTPPGAQTPVPKPPSAAAPKPEPKAEPKPEPKPEPAAAPKDTKGMLTMPVKGSIIRDFQKGKSDGIDISAPAGSPVVAAADGTVAAITRDTAGVPILVIRHADGLLTVYAGIDELSVKRGDTVKRGQKIAIVRDASPPFLHFETRRGIDSVDPAGFL